MGIIIAYIQAHPGALVGIMLIIRAIIQGKRTEARRFVDIEIYRNSPDPNGTNQICRNIKLLENSVWTLMNEVTIMAGVLLLFI
jgi:uroporphyrinogen-III synthase